MANEQNLIPFTSNQNREEAKKNGAKGGKRSGEVRRQRKAMKEQMEMLLSMPFNAKDSNNKKVVDQMAEVLGIDKEHIDNQMAMLIMLWKTASDCRSRNQVTAFQEIRKVVQDEQTVNDDDRVQIINDLPPDGFEVDADEEG